jgi:hypothetical protein
MHYSLMGKMRLPIIDSDLLYRGTLKAGLTVLESTLCENKWSVQQVGVFLQVLPFSPPIKLTAII